MNLLASHYLQSGWKKPVQQFDFLYYFQPMQVLLEFLYFIWSQKLYAKNVWVCVCMLLLVCSPQTSGPGPDEKLSKCLLKEKQEEMEYVRKHGETKRKSWLVEMPFSNLQTFLTVLNKILLFPTRNSSAFSISFHRSPCSHLFQSLTHCISLK